MNETELKKEIDYMKQEKLLIKWLLFYAVSITVCRLLGPNMRFLSLLDWLIFREDVLAGAAFASASRLLPERFLYYMLPFIGLYLMSGRRGQSRTSLFFVLTLVGAGVVNHAGAFVPFVYYNVFYFGQFIPPDLLTVVALFCAIILTFLSRDMYRLVKSLHDKESEISSTRRLPRVAVFLTLVFCFVSPFVEYKALLDSVTRLFGPSYEFVEVHHAGSRIRYITGSPDGKLLAIGTENDLSAWDAETQQCVWSDDVLRKVHRLRFSPSGKYLAAGGKGVPEGGSDIAVYEVDGFKRLPGLEMFEEDLSKEKIFHDLAFRPDEKSLLIAWHKDWDYEQLPRGYYGEEATAIRRSEGPQADLICTELSIEKQSKSYFKTIKTLSKGFDLLLSGGVGFTPSSSFLVYPSYYRRGNLVARNRLYLVDTRTWQEEEIMLEDKYDIRSGMYVIQRGSDWYELVFTKDEKDIYLLAEEGDINGVGRGMNTLAYMLLKFNIETKETQEILKTSNKGARVNPMIRLALSPGERHIVSHGYGPEFGKIKDKKEILRILDLETKKYEQLAFPHKGRGNVGWQYLWLNDATVVVSLYEEDEFLFANIGKERK